MRSGLACVAGLVACGFQHGASSFGTAPPTADAMADTAPDGPLWSPVLYANSNDQLYALDVDHQTYMNLGTIHDANRASIGVNALGFASGTLYGITVAGNELVTIDPATANVTTSVPMTVTKSYWGMTAAPPGDLGPQAVIFAASNETSGNVFRVATDGTVTQLGSLGSSHAIAGDLAWVHGHGLFASMTGSPCNSQCLAKLDPATGQSTIIGMQEPGDMWGLSGFRDQLWVLEGNGEISTADVASGTLTNVFNAGTIDWYDGD